MAQKIDHKFWEKYFKVYDVLNYVIPYQELLDTIVEKLEIKEGDLVLDAGCGTGNLAIKMKEKGARVIGLDNCIEALDRYRMKCPGAEIVNHGLTEPLPFSDNYFDKVAANNVIYTLDKGKRLDVFKEIHRILKPGGTFVVSDVHTDFKPVKIYLDTIKIQKQRTGLLKTVKLVFKVAIPTIKMLIYNKHLVSEGEKGSLDFIEPQEHIDLMRACEFNEISDNLHIYSNQATLNKCKKYNSDL